MATSSRAIASASLRGHARHRRLRPPAPVVRVPRARLRRHASRPTSASKTWAEHHLDGVPRHGRGLEEPPHAHAREEPRRRWGLLQSTSENVRRPFFLLVSVAAIAFIMTLYRRLQPRQRALKWGLPLVLGGALGNVFDRIRYGHVIDFIDYRADWMRKLNKVLARSTTTGPRSTSPTSPSASAWGSWPSTCSRASAAARRAARVARAPAQSGEPSVDRTARPARRRAGAPPELRSTPAGARRRKRRRSRRGACTPTSSSSSASRSRRTSSCCCRGFSSRPPWARSGRGASARAPTSSSTSGSRCCSPASRAARILHVLRRRLLLGLRAPLHRPDAGRLAARRRRECLSPAYDGVWDAAKGVCHPKDAPTASRGRSSGRAGSRTTAGFIGAVGARVVPAQARPVPVLEGGRHGGLRRPARAGVRAHGLPAGRVLLRRDVRSAVGHVVPLAERGERGAVQGAPAAQRALWSLPVHPTQIYESAASLAIAAFCLVCVHPRKRYDGQVFAAFLALYAVARFLLEYLRRRRPGRLPRAVDVAAHRPRAARGGRGSSTSRRGRRSGGSLAGQRGTVEVRSAPHERAHPRRQGARGDGPRARSAPASRRFRAGHGGCRGSTSSSSARTRRAGLHAQQGEGVERGGHARASCTCCPRRRPRPSSSRSSRQLNADPAVDGILVQLPLPEAHRRAARPRRSSTRARTSTASTRQRGPARARAPGALVAVHARGLHAPARARRREARGRAAPSSSAGATSWASRWRSCSSPRNATVTIAHSRTRDLPGGLPRGRRARGRRGQARDDPGRLDQAGRRRHRRRHQPRRRLPDGKAKLSATSRSTRRRRSRAPSRPCRAAWGR